MGKTRSEIQKAYRERQKAKGAAFLEKERARQRQYYVPAADLSVKKRELRNHKNKLRNRLCRLKRKQRENDGGVVEETSGYESFPTDNEPEIDQSDQPRPLQNKLVIKLPNVKKVNARALSRANRTISTLKSEMERLNRKMRAKSKQVERLSKKLKQTPNKNIHVTPKKKTVIEVEALNLTPRRKKVIRRQLLTSNVLIEEIKEAKKMSGKKKVNSIHRIISGSLARKYRCLKGISSSVNVCRRALAKTDNKQFSIRKEQRHSLSKVVANSVIDFFNREDNSRTQPGKADAKKTEGQKEKEQTKVLTDYLKNLHDKYTAECPENKISLSTFSRLRPTNVLLASFISRNSCQCIHHQNMALKVQSLRKAGFRISENPENLFVHRDDLEQLLSTLPDKVTYRIWQKVEIGNGKLKMQIVEKEEDKETFKREFIKQLHLFEDHVQRVREQYQQVRKLKEKLPDDEMIIQMDFAENYSCRTLNEVQTAYWNQTMVTIHPIVAYFKQNGELNHRSYVIVSDEMAHCSSTVCAFLDKIIPELKALNPKLQSVHYWTDSPSSQYRNRYIFHVIAKHHEIYNVYARWNYFEVGHGKGPCDGLGGTAKRMADMAIRQGHVQIQNAEDFYTWGVKSSMSAKFLFVGSEETKTKQVEMTSIKTKPLKGTMKLHAVGPSDTTGVIMTRETSCYCHICLTGSYCDSWEMGQFKCVTASMTETINVSCDNHTSSSDAVFSSPSRDTENGDEGISNNETEHTITYQNKCMKDIDIGSIVAVVYENKWYVGEVKTRDEEDREFEIRFMEKAKEMFRWPKYEDSLWVQEENVLCILNSLVPSGKSGRLFKLSSDEISLVDQLYMSQKK